MLYEIEGPGFKDLAREGKERYVGLRTFICPDTEVIRQCEVLYGKRWLGFSKRAKNTPRIRRIKATWHPEGYDDAAMLRAHYDSWGKRRPGYAKLLTKTIGRKDVPILREPTGKKRLIQGPADAYNVWQVVSGHAFNTDYMMAVIIQTAYRKDQFSLRRVLDIKNTVNRRRMVNIGDAPPRTLLCLYAETDGDYDPAEELVAVNYYLLWDSDGWNNITVRKGCWIVQQTPVFSNTGTMKKPTWTTEGNPPQRVLVFDKKHYMDMTRGTDGISDWALKESKEERRDPFRVASWRGQLQGLTQW